MQRTTTHYVISKRHMLLLEERGKGQILPSDLLTFDQPPISHQICELLLCLMASSGEEARRCGISDSNSVNQVKGKQQTCLFTNGENIIFLPSTQAFQYTDIHWSPLIGEA